MFQFFVLAVAVCQTAAGVPCFTLTYEHSVWALVKSPVRDLVAAEEAGTMAVRQDGSSVNSVQPAKRFTMRNHQEAQRDFLHPVMFYVDRAYRRSTNGDRNCRAIVAAFGGSLEPVGTSAILGEPVVNWKFKTLYGDSTASLFEAKSLRRGEPDRQIFAPPKGK